MMIALLLVSVTVVWLTHYLLTYSFTYWKKLGVPGPKPTMLVGNIGSALSMKETAGMVYARWYREFKNFLYVGIYNMQKPALLIRDKNLIEKVLITDFQYFQDNETFVDPDNDPLLAKNPFTLKGDTWKVIRSQLTAGITAVKIKNMFPYMIHVGKDLCDYLKTESEVQSENGIEMKEVAAKFCTDCVASSAYGIDGKSFKEKDAEFRQMGKKIFHMDIWAALKTTLIFVAPNVAKLLKFSFLPKDVQIWFTGVLKETIDYRQKHKIVRNDYLDYLLTLKNQPEKYELTEHDVLAHAISFYAEGCETVSTTLGFALYEIAKNTDVQEKLREEVDAKLEETGGDITYEAVQHMTYMEMVIAETLRMYPPGLFLTRTCTKPYLLPAPDGSNSSPKVPVEVNTAVVIPVYGLHYDPAIYPDPEKFCPERFTDEEKNKRRNIVYLPLGEGPRQCPAYKYALLQLKVAITSILRNFTMKLNPKTPEKIELDPKMVLITPKGGLWVNIYPRTK